MTPCFHIMSHMARCVGNSDMGVVLQQVVKSCNLFAMRHHHSVWLCHLILDSK